MRGDHGDKIISAFKLVSALVDKLCLHILDELTDCPMMVAVDDQFVHDTDRVIYVLKKFSPANDLMPQETFACPGAIAALPKTFTLIKRVNKAKDKFKKVVQNYKLKEESSDTKFVRDILARAGYGAIKLKQVYRHIQFVSYHPRRIAWTKGKNGSSFTINKKEAERRLLKAGQGEHIDVQLSKLSLLDHKAKLIIHRESKPYWLVNLARQQAEPCALPERIRTSLPLFYKFDVNATIPEVVFSQKAQRTTTSVRADKRLDKNPFLPSISAYRYRHLN